MRDTRLWRLLDPANAALTLADPAELVRLLRELVELPPHRQAAFWGRLPFALTHPDAHVRAAAMAAQGGATGVLAFRRLATGLNDPEPTVQQAAVRALHASSADDSSRFIHAVFHRDPAVRQAAVVAGDAGQMNSLCLYLLADPECAPTVLERVKPDQLSLTQLPTVVAFAQDGLCSPRQARYLLAGVGIGKLVHHLEQQRVRTPEHDTAVLAAAVAGDREQLQALAAIVDPLDAVLDLFWRDLPADNPSGEPSPDADDPVSTAGFFRQLENVQRTSPASIAQHAAAAVILAAVRHGDWTAPAAVCCAFGFPQLLACDWIERDIRHQAIQAFHDTREKCRQYAASVVRGLLTDELCRRPSGQLDLWAVSGVLQLLDDPQPIRHLLDWFGVDAVVDAFQEAPLESALLFRLADDSDRGRLFLIQELQRRSTGPAFAHLALLIQVVETSELAFLDPLSPDDAVQACIAVLDLLASTTLKLSPNKIRVVGETLGSKILAGAASAFLESWLQRHEPQRCPLAIQILGVLARRMSGLDFTDALLRLPPPLLPRSLVAIAWCPGFPYSTEQRLARRLASHADETVAAWSAERTAKTDDSAWTAAAALLPASGARLPATESNRIARADASDLPAALRPCLASPRSGVCEALATRKSPEPSAEACVALLGSHDDLPAIDEQFSRYFDHDTPGFLDKVDAQVAREWNNQTDISLFGHAWLCRWERHAFLFGDVLSASPDSCLESLRFAERLQSQPLRTQLWQAVARACMLWRYRDREKLRSLATLATAQYLVSRLNAPNGYYAARILMSWLRSGVAPAVLEEARPAALEKLPTLADDVRRELQDWIDSRGLQRNTAAPVDDLAWVAEDLLAQIAACQELDRLEAWCRSPQTRVVEGALLQLLLAGEPGLERLSRLLASDPPPPRFTLLARSIPDWSAGPSLTQLSHTAASAALPEMRYRLYTGLLERELQLAGSGPPALASPQGAAWLTGAIAAVGCDSESVWFGVADWNRLLAYGADPVRLAIILAVSPQPVAYPLALQLLQNLKDPAPEAVQAMRDFLDLGDERSHPWRLKTARWLHYRGDDDGFPLLIEEYLADPHARASLLAHAPAERVDAVTAAALAAGDKLFSEARLILLLEANDVDPVARDRALESLVLDGALISVRERALRLKRKGERRSDKLRAVAEHFAWGVLRGRELTGRMFSVQMIAGTDLGYTRFSENKIYINPLPVLRREKHGGDVVQGLILHELGHHMYHRGPEPEAVWKEAQDEGLHELLNLVSDEHLERRLRALDGGFGDQLKRLGAFAFQHSRRETDVHVLLEHLQGRAWDVLTQVTLGVGRSPGSVVLESGRVLLEMEQAGMSFARFFRALRMGLGDRHADPLVAAGLKLFRGKFRNLEMPQLLAIARRLREIFGSQTDLLRSFSQDALCAGDADELLAEAEGITNEELQSEIRRITDPRELTALREEDSGAGGGRMINVIPDENFETLTTILPVAYDPVERAKYAQAVAPNARRMRQFLYELGLARQPVGQRSSGRRIDRPQLRNLVLRGDPRILQSRRTVSHTDLFLGVVIDCSGSMTHNNHMEQAKLFASLLAEAALGFQGIDLRLFGFTDEVIYDCGNAARSAVHRLSAGGGNNDAGALWHAAQVAKASPRQAKLLVMISDGLPTECSTAALTALVRRLTNRMQICCAQVAVEALEEICFPHYVCLKDDDLESSIRRFGAIVARLVRRVTGG
ncbi:vWA domain-containing protein [Lignipirellula cremea]|uniref:VWFA domain-containing protein n=1 Tax=Lignipirellula cremea TaxID=2528010 RepID=A0A518DS05_9BACT|nr:vWA domain-containing protein [Lignipirellula cremea]QDU94617.1 hypothetical protein Pla8534_24100 [Lignipirellula cremea]